MDKLPLRPSESSCLQSGLTDLNSHVDLPLRGRTTQEPQSMANQTRDDAEIAAGLRRANEQTQAMNHRKWCIQSLFQRPEYAAAAAAVHESEILSRPTPPLLTTTPKPLKTIVRLVQADTFAAAQALKREYPSDNIAVLNHANAQFPGGGFLQGSSAQEEDLCHCSTLYETLNRSFYPLRNDELIYSPDVWVVKAKDSTQPTGRRDLPRADWFSCNVISCAAVQRPRLHQCTHTDSDGHTFPTQSWANDTDRTLMRDKILWILNAAMRKNIERLVLGAFGCGAFRNPPREVARMMKQILVDGGNGDGPAIEFGRYGLKEIVVAIFDPGDPQHVWDAFMAEFRQGEGLHLTRNGNEGIPVPGEIQYTIFPAGY